MQQASYLESRILTAPPHRLHLMLIEGAIRFGRQADDALQRAERAVAEASLMRLVDIVGEMLAGLRHDKTPINRRLADLYWFLFRRVAQAKINSDAAALAEALRILEYERQTWQLVCEKFGGIAAAAGPPAPHSRPFDSHDAHGPASSVSWQA
ncbi:MAG TPA: flagellar export chaperone FliS [Lacipirellulaceae bacterium]|nr:flagellar export chaperone FliS [Lacipirellulaceae bacterium]